MTAPLISLVYTSRATEVFTDDALRELLRSSRASNERDDVTGMLLHRAGRFFQVLEGPEDAVRRLIRRIEADPRHTDVRIVRDERIGSRTFADWTMGFEPISEPRTALPDGFRDTFDDLDAADEPDNVRRAIGELALWFRVRSGSSLD